MYELVIDGQPWVDADGKSRFNYVQSCRLFFDLSKLGHEVEWLQVSDLGE